MRGGKRKNAGRPKGSSDKSVKEIREILNDYSEDLLNKAYKLAMEGNIAVLNKLLDKILPSLNAVDMQSGAERDNVFEVRLINTKDDKRTTDN